MPTSTFMNLKPTKQQQIFQALLHEFSHHRLMVAQVARIVNECGIARGSFYKYFKDINDSYEYTLREVLKTVHFDVFKAIRLESQNSLKAFYQVTRSFIDQLESSPYYQFYRLYVLYNQHELSHGDYDYRQLKPAQLVLKVNGRNVDNHNTVVVTYKWATDAAHNTIRRILSGADASQELADLKILLQLLNRGLS